MFSPPRPIPPPRGSPCADRRNVGRDPRWACVPPSPRPGTPGAASETASGIAYIRLGENSSGPLSLHRDGNRAAAELQRRDLDGIDDAGRDFENDGRAHADLKSTSSDDPCLLKTSVAHGNPSHGPRRRDDPAGCDARGRPWPPRIRRPYFILPPRASRGIPRTGEAVPPGP